MGIAAMILGIVGFVTWFVPVGGLPIPVIGLVLGISTLRQPSAPNRGMAIAGVIMCSIGLLLSITVSLGFISLFFWY